ncbi:hypothetical protein K2Y11_16955 [bacterium]|nr:hypothetical protein [bacterium]
MTKPIILFAIFLSVPLGQAGEINCWRVDEVRAGMAGYGRTVIHGTKPERFDVEIIGVLHHVQPGRDMILARFKGLGLEKSGVMQGMSGSPVYIDERLLGAVAYTWEFGLEPIGGITPFTQMVEFCDATKLKEDKVAHRTPVPHDLTVGGNRGRMIPIRTPLAVSGMSTTAMEVLSKDLAPWGLIPVQGGAANVDLVKADEEHSLEPGSAMAVGLVLGDVSVTAVGTVTTVHEGRVYGFGHPFLELGRCDIPLMSAYIHLVMPLQTASFKMGSALNAKGTVQADVSTGIAGNIGPRSVMIPITIHMTTDLTKPREFHCEVAPIPALFSSLVMTSIGSCLDGEGKAPAELTATVKADIKLTGHPPLHLEDSYSGDRFKGPAGLLQALSPLAKVLQLLTNNTVEPMKIESIECWAEISGTRRSANIVHAYPARAELIPGETLEVTLEFQPFRGSESNTASTTVVKRLLKLPIPADLPPGDYVANVTSAPEDFQRELKHHPRWIDPRVPAQLHESISQQLLCRYSDVVIRVETKDVGVGLNGTEFPDLPTGKVNIIASDTSSEVYRVPRSLSLREKMEWALEGSKTIPFKIVEKRDRISAAPKASLAGESR